MMKLSLVAVSLSLVLLQSSTVRAQTPGQPILAGEDFSTFQCRTSARQADDPVPEGKYATSFMLFPRSHP